MDPVRFDRLAKFAARRPSRRAVLGSLAGGLFAALGGGGVPAGTRADWVPPACADARCAALLGGTPSACDLFPRQIRCFGGDCALCLGTPSDVERNFGRFERCVADKPFCTRPYASCCDFCAGWASPSCGCCRK